MTIQTIYVEASSKKALNKAIECGHDPIGWIYTPWEERATPLSEMRIGDVVKVFSKRVNGQPYAKAYGTIANKNGQLFVK